MRRCGYCDEELASTNDSDHCTEVCFWAEQEEKMKTPGWLYAVRQTSSDLMWRVVPIEREQGEAMRARKEPHVYETSTQAHAVKNRLNGPRYPRTIVIGPAQALIAMVLALGGEAPIIDQDRRPKLVPKKSL
jgi:hypothetical protein